MKIIATLLLATLISLPARAQNSEPIARNAAKLTSGMQTREREDLAYELKHKNSRWFRAMSKPHANYFAIKRSFDKYFAAHKWEESKCRELGEEWLKTKIFYLDKYGFVQDPPPFDSKLHAHPAVVDSAGVTTTTVGDWHMIGPLNSAETDYSSVGNHGGYVYMNRIDPTNPAKMFCSFVTGGLWMTSDTGASWTLTDANMPDEVYYDIDVCIATPQIVYAISDSHVIKSTNGGISWNETSLTSAKYSGQAYDIAASPIDPNVVVARWGANVYRTSDGGTTWSTIVTGLPNYSLWDCSVLGEMVDWSTTNNQVVYFLSFVASPGNQVDVYRSANSGAAFSKITTITLDPSAIGQHVGWAKLFLPSDDTAAFYVAIGTGASAYQHTAVQMYKLNNTTGAEISKRVNMIGDTNVSKLFLLHGDIAMDRRNENRLVFSSYSYYQIYYSTDNGATFLLDSVNLHYDPRSIDFVNGHAMIGTDGESVLSTDGGKTNHTITNSISNHELWGFGEAFKANILASGNNHGPCMIGQPNYGYAWWNATGADQGNTDVNPLDNSYVYSQGYSNYLYHLTGLQKLQTLSDVLDEGGIYSYFNNFEFHPNLYYTLITHHAGQYPVGNPNLKTWINSLIRSDDNGTSISVVHTFADQVFREKICMRNPNYIYVVDGLSGNTLQKTTDGGATWKDITPTSIESSSQTNISDIAVSDVDSNEVWITYSGVQTACKVLQTKDGGATWINLTQPILTANPNTKIIFQRGSKGGVYVGNHSGIYYRNDSMSTWAMLGTGLVALDVRNMFINYNLGKLRIGTSRGAWEHNLYETSPPIAQISASTNKVTCTAAPIQFMDYSTVRNASATWNWSFPEATPATSTLENPVVTYEGLPNGDYTVSLTVTDAYGTSTQTLPNFIHVAATSLPLPFTQTFEDSFPPTGLSFSSTGNNWTQDTVGAFGLSKKCARFSEYATGQSGVVASMITDPIELTPTGTGAYATHLSFDVAFADYPGNSDTLAVYVSTDCGTTYTAIYERGDATLKTRPAQYNFFVPTAGDWRKDSIDIDSYVGRVVKFKISFWGDGGNNIYLDNLNVYETSGENGVASNRTENSKFNVACYPVPATNQLNVSFKADRPSTTSLRVYDLLGSTVLRQSGTSFAGENKYALDISRIPRGTYFVEVLNGSDRSVQSVVIE